MNFFDTSPIEEQVKIDIQSLIRNQDEHVQNIFLNRQQQDETIHFLVIGSTLMEDGEPGYGERLATALGQAYNDTLKVDTIAIDETSERFMELLEDGGVSLVEDYDVVLFEPFTLKNNGLITIEDSHQHIEDFYQYLVERVPDVALIIHPPHPLFKATYYPNQVQALKEFAAAKGFPYIDHWTDWPATDNEDLKNYLSETQAPNSDGAEIWSNALISYFIAN